jgi:hypothetical protein
MGTGHHNSGEKETPVGVEIAIVCGSIPRTFKSVRAGLCKILCPYYPTDKPKNKETYLRTVQKYSFCYKTKKENSSLRNSIC